MATDVPPNYIGGNTDGTDYVGDIVNNVSGSYYEIVGGNQRSNAATGNVEGNITLNLDNIDVSYSNGFICGGNLLNYLDKPYDHKETMGYVSGKVTINFNSGTLSAGQGLYGGNAGGIPYQTNNWVGSVEMNLNGGNVIGPDAYVAGSGSAYANVKGDVVINLNAGEISEIIGVNGGGKVGGKVLINAPGGTVGTIYAGGQGASSVVLGSTNIVLGGNVNVTGDVYGGGWYGNDLIKSQIKNGTNITISGNASVGGTIYGGGVNDGTKITGSKVLNIGTADNAYEGTKALKVANFDRINIAKGTTASVENLEYNLTGKVDGSRTYVKEGANFTVEGDIVNNLNNVENSASFTAGLTSVKVDQVSGGSAIVKGTVRTVIDGENTKLHYFYAGNGGNQKGVDPHFRAMQESRVGAVDLTVNNGSIDMIVGNGAMLSDVDGNIDIKINGGSIGGIYALGSNGIVGGDVNITVNGGTLLGDSAGEYNIAIATGGANNGDSEKSASKIAGSTNVVIGGDAKIYADVYGGGWGGFSTAKQGGLIEGGTNITIVENAYISGGIYGGGIAGATEIGGTKTLNIGTADISYNGASTLNVADFQKINVVNGSAEFASFTQAAEGTLVSISDKGKLVMSLNSTSQLSNTSFENAGELVFKRGALSDSDTVALKSYTGAGSVSAYGGTFANGVFTAGNSANFESAAITVGTGASDVQSVKLGDKLSLDFNVEGLGEAALTLNEIKASTDLSGIDGDVLAAFDVDLTDNGNDYSVVFSAYVGEIEDIAKLAAWHKGSDGVWTKLDTTIDYVDGVASILIDGFSSYAFTQEVPEPATCAAILGAIALALAAYRRRK